MRQIVLDTETTGLQPQEGHRIIEIGCIELINRKFTGKRYHQYINPQREVDEGALAVHGITNELLKDKPIFSHITQELINFVEGAELIIHNAPFDVGFINHELQLTQQKWKPITDYCRIFDTLILARQLHVGQRNSLDALCKRYGVDNSQREMHGALLDAHLLAQVYLAMTGGQGSLFGETQVTEVSAIEKMNMKTVITKKRNLCVIKADVKEMEAHNKKLEAIKKTGKCLWMDAT